MRLTALEKNILSRDNRFEREKDNVETSKNTLIAMLEDLLRNDDKEAKKKKLSEKYGLIMNTDTERRINTMCNLSEALIERTTEKALEQGIEALVLDNIEEGKSKEQIVQKLVRRFKLNEKDAEMYYDKFAV